MTYFRLVSARVRSDAQYRLSFVLRLLSSSLLVVGDYVVIWALLRKVQEIGGWDIGNVTFLYGMATLPFRLADAIVGGPVEQCANYIRAGEFDRFLLRPIRPFVALLGDAFALRRLGQAFAVVPVFVAGIRLGDLKPGGGTPIVLALMLINAALLSSGLFVVLCCLAFWSPNTNEAANAFTYGSVGVAQYPVHVMDRSIRVIAFTAVPAAFMAYVPSFLVVDAPNPMGIRPWMSWTSLLVGPTVAALGAKVWGASLRRYKSTGS